jgi:hypothetical protein
VGVSSQRYLVGKILSMVTGFTRLDDDDDDDDFTP